MSRALRVSILVVVALAAGYALWKHGPIRQDPGYHRFADTRTMIGVPSALNVVSNLPFLLVGVAGIAFLRRGPTRDRDGPFRPGAHTAFDSLRERPAYVLFFVGVLLTTFGSGYYHLAPSTDRLFWDRLPMTVGFTALFAAVIAERISVYWSRMLLLPFVFLGVASVVFWRITEQSGRGDLRPYLFVQFFPMVALPLMLALFPPRYSRGSSMLVVILVYAVAKAAEYFDPQILELTQRVVSGHSVKHLVAALATWFVLDMLRKRGRARLPLDDAMAEHADQEA